jgi:putative ABC transport system ATP-binding protein
LVSNPALILADEPTGNLDSASTTEIMGLFAELNGEGRTVVLITHEEEVARFAKRVVRLRDGHIQSDTRTVQSDSRQEAS